MVEFTFSSQSIGDNVSFLRSVTDGEVVGLQSLKPACLSARKLGLCVEILERSVVGDDFEWMALEVDSPDLECVDDGKEFLLMDGIVELSRCHLARFKGNRLIAMPLILRQDCSDCIVGSIGGDLKRLALIRKEKNWSGGECHFDGAECRCSFGRPIVLLIFLQEIRHRSGDGGEVGNEPLVVGSEAEE